MPALLPTPSAYPPACLPACAAVEGFEDILEEDQRGLLERRWVLGLKQKSAGFDLRINLLLPLALGMLASKGVPPPVYACTEVGVPSPTMAV